LALPNANVQLKKLMEQGNNFVEMSVHIVLNVNLNTIAQLGFNRSLSVDMVVFKNVEVPGLDNATTDRLEIELEKLIKTDKQYMLQEVTKKLNTYGLQSKIISESANKSDVVSVGTVAKIAVPIVIV